MPNRFATLLDRRGGIALTTILWPLAATCAIATSTISEEAIAESAVTASAPASERPLRGMTVSCPTWGPIWGSSKMAETLATLDTVGVEWVSIHPYAGVRRNGSIRFTSAFDLDFLQRAVELVADADMQLFWKPHLAYWGSFEWRGTIAFGDDQKAWRRFFDDYRHFIVDQARFAETHAIPLFSIGLEYEATTGYEAEWRAIIAAVREVYSGTITYSANWDRLDDVPFWDAVDLIGVQGYFPLSTEADPSRETLFRGWDAPLATLRALSEHHDKAILFAEVGFDLAPSAAAEPWKTASRDDAATRALRRRLLDVTLERLEAEPFVHGMFWWKWIPGARPNRDFAMQHPDALDALRSAWGDQATRSTAR
ncbi:MAG: hypothetical protein AAGE94_14710 [Acidobacteriota bacterium]